MGHKSGENLTSGFALVSFLWRQYLDCPGENIDSYRGRANYLSIDMEGLRRIGLNADLSGLPVIEEIIAGAD